VDITLKKVGEIKNMAEACPWGEKLDFAEILLNDERNSVKKIGEKMIKDVLNRAREEARLAQMWQIEDEIRQKGYEIICGCDEVGRGPLAGPVVAAAVILPRDVMLWGINDSKKISEKKREELDEQIRDKAIAIGIAEISAQVIDEMNILEASRLAMVQAVSNLNKKVDFVMIDGLENPRMKEWPQQAVVKGDGKCISIAAASIVAKVYRDKLMVEMAKKYPQFGFEENKGYGTKKHYAALKEFGPCEIHRRSFDLKLY